MTTRPVIAVDGLAGSGKSTLARALADRIHFIHLNTGLLYRAVGLLALRTKVNPNNEAEIVQELSKHKIQLDLSECGQARVILDGQDVTSSVQTPDVSEATSQASQFAAIRTALHDMQRNAFPAKPIVAEGRDMGTVVFPDAPLKFFIVADEKVRIERRLRQLLSGSRDQSPAARAKVEEQIGIEIRERDRRDTERQVAPTLAAADSIQINNSSDSLEKVVDRMVQFARARNLVS